MLSVDTQQFQQAIERFRESVQNPWLPQEKVEINVPLLRKELEHITAHPEEWDQEEWIVGNTSDTGCGTTGCLAGNAVLHSARYEVRFIHDDESPEVVDTETGNDNVEIMAAARELFGLTYRQAHRLFHGSNSLMDLWEIASQLTHGEIQVPDLSNVDVADTEKKLRMCPM